MNVGLFLKIEGCDWGSSCIWVNTAFGPKKDDLTNHLQVLNNEKLYDIYRSASTVRIVNSGCGRPQCGQACCVCVCMWGQGMHLRFLLGHFLKMFIWVTKKR